MTAGEAVRLIAAELTDVCGEDSLFEARCMVSELIGILPKALPLHRGMELSKEQLVALSGWVQRRKEREPLQYILGQWSFYGYDFAVNPSALIPRPETEELCKAAIDRIRAGGCKSVLDLCTGSGCIAIVLKLETGVDVAASDVSEEAVVLAKENAACYEADIRFYTGDLFSALCGETFDLIVCNPPYLSAADLKNMQPELAYEPRIALDGGSDGLDFYRRIAAEYRRYLNPGGALLMEIGADEGERVQSLFPGSSIMTDLSNHARIVAAERDASGV